MAASSRASGVRAPPQQPNLMHAPNFLRHSLLYVSHHSSSHSCRVLPQTMILKRACSSGVQATPWRSPAVTGALLRRLWRCEAASAAPASARRRSTAKALIFQGVRSSNGGKEELWVWLTAAGL